MGDCALKIASGVLTKESYVASCEDEYRFHLQKYWGLVHNTTLLHYNMIIYCLFHFLSQTPLHIAAQRGDMNKVTNLVGNGASVDSKDKHGVSETMLIAVEN